MDDCQIETDQQILIPETYIGGISERLSVYNKSMISKKRRSWNLSENLLIDRFGKLPEEVVQLFEVVKIQMESGKARF